MTYRAPWWLTLLYIIAMIALFPFAVCFELLKYK